MYTEHEEEIRERYGEPVRKVVIDGEEYRRRINLVPPWDQKEILIGYINRENKLIKPIDENQISEDEWRSNLGVNSPIEETIIAEIPMDSGGIFCKECGSRTLFHDRLEKFFCPWCEEP